MQSQPPTPLEALRGHSHVVVYTPENGGLWSSIAPSIKAVGIEVEVIGHPLLCMAALCWHEFNGRRPGSRESTAFAAVDVDDIDRLEPMLASIRTKLPHVSVWVIGSNFTIPVIEGKPRAEPAPHPEQRPSAARAEFEAKQATPPRTPPKLRISRTGAAEEAGIDRGAADTPPSRQRDLDHIESILRGSPSDGAPRDPARKSSDPIHPGDEVEDPAEPSATRLTSDEIAMLMGDHDDDRPPGPRGNPQDGGGRAR